MPLWRSGSKNRGQKPAAATTSAAAPAGADTSATTGSKDCGRLGGNPDSAPVSATACQGAIRAGQHMIRSREGPITTGTAGDSCIAARSPACLYQQPGQGHPGSCKRPFLGEQVVSHELQCQTHDTRHLPVAGAATAARWAVSCHGDCARDSSINSCHSSFAGQRWLSNSRVRCHCPSCQKCVNAQLLVASFVEQRQRTCCCSALYTSCSSFSSSAWMLVEGQRTAVSATEAATGLTSTVSCMPLAPLSDQLLPGKQRQQPAEARRCSEGTLHAPACVARHATPLQPQARPEAHDNGSSMASAAASFGTCNGTGVAAELASSPTGVWHKLDCRCTSCALPVSPDTAQAFGLPVGERFPREADIRSYRSGSAAAVMMSSGNAAMAAFGSRDGGRSSSVQFDQMAMIAESDRPRRATEGQLPNFSSHCASLAASSRGDCSGLTIEHGAACTAAAAADTNAGAGCCIQPASSGRPPGRASLPSLPASTGVAAAPHSVVDRNGKKLQAAASATCLRTETAGSDSSVPSATGTTLLDVLHAKYYGASGRLGTLVEATAAASDATAAARLSGSPAAAAAAATAQLTSKLLLMQHASGYREHRNRYQGSGGMKMFGDINKLFTPECAEASRMTAYMAGGSSSEGKRKRHNDSMATDGAETGSNNGNGSCSRGDTPATLLSPSQPSQLPQAQPPVQVPSAEKHSTKVVRKFSLSPRFPRKLLITHKPEDAGEAGAGSGRGNSGGASIAGGSSSSDGGASRESRNRSKLAVPAAMFSWGKLTTDQLDALEACAWLMEAGFPQYVQLFQERQLPVDHAEVAMDHSQLSESLLKPLYRRLQTLAKLTKLNLNLAAAGLKLDCTSAGQNDQGALSHKWHMDKKSGKWSHATALAATTTSITPAASAVLMGTSPPHVCVAEPGASGTAATADEASAVTPGSGTSSCDSALGSSTGDTSPQPARMRAHRGSAPHTASPTSGTGGDSAALSKSRDSIVSPSSSSSSVSSASTSASSSATSSPVLPASRRRLRKSDSARRQNDAARLPASASASSKQAAMVIGEPVLIRSAETDERLRRLGCLDLAAAAAKAATAGASGGCACVSRVGGSTFTSSLSETLYVLPANHVPGTFPVTLEQKVIRRSCSVCTKKQPNVSSSLMPAVWSTSTGPLQVGGISGSAGNCNAISIGSSGAVGSAATSSSSKAARTALGGNLVRSDSWYDNIPIAGKQDTEANVTASAAAGSMRQLDDIVRELSDFSDQHGIETANANRLMPELCVEQRANTDGLENDATSAAARGNSECVPKEAATRTADSGMSNPLASQSGSSLQEDRRDSGVGLSLTREPASSKQGRKKSRKSLLWRGFTSSAAQHRYASDVNHLTASQLTCLRKLCLLKVTAQLEEHCPRDVANCILSGTLLRPGHRMAPRPEPYESEAGLVFSVPLYVLQQIEGHPLPASIRQVMASLRQVAHETIGIFRRPGVKSRIQKLRNDIDAGKEVSLMDGVQAYDLADLLKQFFRELPECLFTDKLSEVFLAIHQYVPQTERADAMRAALILLPCENRQALRALLDFMAFVAKHCATNQMTTSNLAVCFAPSLFSLGTLAVGSLAASGGYPAASRSPKVPRKNSGPSTDHVSDLLDQKYAHECLRQMLDQGDRLFKVPEEFAACTFTCRDEMLPSQLTVLLKDSSGSHRIHVDECIRGLLKEFRGKSKGWTVDSLPAYVGKESLTVTVSHKPTSRDGGPLPLWRASTEVEAPPVEVLTRLVQERHLWDDCEEVRCCRKALDSETELVHFMSRPNRPLQDCSSETKASEVPEIEHVVLRSWRAQLQQDPGTCVYISHSVDPAACAMSQHQQQQGSAWMSPSAAAVTYASHYLVEPCGAGKSRVTHVSSMDLLGHLPAWYERQYACRAARSLAKLRDSFRRQHACMAEAGVPETSV